MSVYENINRIFQSMLNKPKIAVPGFKQMQKLRREPCSGIDDLKDSEDIFSLLSPVEKELLTSYSKDYGFEDFFEDPTKLNYLDGFGYAFEGLLTKGFIIQTTFGYKPFTYKIKPILVQVVLNVK